MGTLGIIALVLGVLGAFTSLGLGISQNSSNTKSVEDTNKTNYQIAQETNQSNVEQANLAYQRSLPYNQVSNLMSAGMSKAGALSALTGGGVYNPPVLQSSQMQAPQKDYSGIMSAMERFSSIPANVEQSQLIEGQKNALQVDLQNKINADRRAQEQHDFNMWKQGYDKNTALMLDSASSKISNALIDSGKSIQDFKDFEDMLHTLNLDNDKDIRNINYIARQQLEDGVRSKFESERARQDQENKNTASKDAHTLALDTLKNSEVGRTLSAARLNEIDAHIRQLEDQHMEYLDSTDARLKENKLRESRATLEQLLTDFNVKKQEFINSIYFDKNGIPKPDAEILKTSVTLKELWRFIGNVIPIEYLGDILKGMLAISK